MALVRSSEEDVYYRIDSMLWLRGCISIADAINGLQIGVEGVWVVELTSKVD